MITIVLPTVKRLRKAWADLQESRADADPMVDEAIFYHTWSLGGTLEWESDDVQNGQLPHQKAQREWFEFDYARRMKALDAATAEAANYLNTFVLFLVAAGLVAQPLLLRYTQSPYVVTVWLPAVALIMLLRSHASPLRSLTDNYIGPGRFAAELTSEFAVVNAIRDTLRRRNADMQRAKRKLAIVCLLYQACIVGVCAFLTIRGLLVVFG